MSTKQRVLAILEANRGKSISGKAIADRLSWSRAAVWKAVEELRKEGFQISAVTNRGYRLAEDDDLLSVAGIRRYLMPTLSEAGIHVHDILQSTNITAKRLALEGVTHGTVVLAEEQSGGKGRFERRFQSPRSSGLYMSLVLHPAQLALSTPTLITVLAAVSVCEAIESLSDKKPGIKWVNDILLDGKKICGISCETTMDLESRSMPWVVVGIGINVTTKASSFPEELRQIVGSLYPEGKAEFSRNRLAAEVINRMASSAAAASSPNYSIDLLEKYKKRLVMLNKRITVVLPEGNYQAKAVDVDESGQLIVQKDDGEICTLLAGEISTRLDVKRG